MAPLAWKLSRALREALSDLLGTQLTPEQWKRAGLPPCYWGLGLRMASPHTTSHAAYWTSMAMHQRIVPRLAVALGRPIVEQQPEVPEMCRAATELEQLGVKVGEEAYMAATPHASQAYADGPWAQDRSLDHNGKDVPPEESRQKPPSITRESIFQHALSRLFAMLEGITAQQVWSELDATQRSIMLSFGGQGTGDVWVAGHQAPEDYMQNTQWITATLLRLGARPCVPGEACSLRSRDKEACGQSLTTQPHHPELCKCGAARSRTHRRLEEVLRDGIETAGGEADLERVIPELSAVAQGNERLPKEARMDLTVSWPGELQQRWIDVSVRSPHAQNIGPTATAPGTAAAGGERDKRTRYGQLVQPLVFETYGRLGYASQRTLQGLAAAARLYGKASPRVMRRWRLMLERHLLF